MMNQQSRIITDSWFNKRYYNETGFKVIMDFVPNHTSNQHDWFLKSIKRIPPYTDYYVWKDAKYINGKRHPPNNWVTGIFLNVLYYGINKCL